MQWENDIMWLLGGNITFCFSTFLTARYMCYNLHIIINNHTFITGDTVYNKINNIDISSSCILHTWSSPLARALGQQLHSQIVTFTVVTMNKQILILKKSLTSNEYHISYKGMSACVVPYSINLFRSITWCLTESLLLNPRIGQLS